jgi:hypothetical protein
MTAEIVQFPVKERDPLRGKRWTALRKRLAHIGKVLDIREEEITRAGEDFFNLVRFTSKYNQSLDWIVRGDPVCMIRAAARS